MTEFETIELIATIVMFTPSVLITLFLKKRRDLLKLAVGASCVSFSFLFSNLEAFFLPEMFNFLEHLCLFFAAITFSIVMIIELKNFYSQKSIEKQKEMERM